MLWRQVVERVFSKRLLYSTNKNEMAFKQCMVLIRVNGCSIACQRAPDNTLYQEFLSFHLIFSNWRHATSGDKKYKEKFSTMLQQEWRFEVSYKFIPWQFADTVYWVEPHFSLGVHSFTVALLSRVSVAQGRLAASTGPQFQLCWQCWVWLAGLDRRALHALQIRVDRNLNRRIIRVLVEVDKQGD